MYGLQKRKNNEFNNKVINIFNYLTINGKYKLIGSANLKSTLYINDYDLEEQINLSPIKIKKLFQKKFKEVYNDNDIYITDFKCGVNEKNEPLRWSYNDVMNGIKDGYKLEDCIMTKATLKLDIVALINGIFTEYSENYYIKYGKLQNYDNIILKKEEIYNSIYDSYVELYDEENYFKALKRIFTLLKIENQKLNEKTMKYLIKIFNGNLGLLNNIINQISILKLLLEQKFKPVDINDIHNNLQIIKQSISNIFEIKIQSTIYNFIDNICHINNKHITYELIDKLKNKLLIILNKESFKIYENLI